jgi:hypothetical protein
MEVSPTLTKKHFFHRFWPNFCRPLADGSFSNYSSGYDLQNATLSIVFFWLLPQDKLNTRDRLRLRHMALESYV